MERERERKGRKVEKIKDKKQAEGHKTISKERGCKGRPRHPKMTKQVSQSSDSQSQDQSQTSMKDKNEV